LLQLPFVGIDQNEITGAALRANLQQIIKDFAARR
jgi:hypothetical protein